MANKNYGNALSSRNSWFNEENRPYDTGKLRLKASPIYPDLRKLIIWRNESEFPHDIWQIGTEHVDEQICVRPEDGIAMQPSYWFQKVDQITEWQIVLWKVYYWEFWHGWTQFYSFLGLYLCHISSFQNNPRIVLIFGFFIF